MDTILYQTASKFYSLGEFRVLAIFGMILLFVVSVSSIFSKSMDDRKKYKVKSWDTLGLLLTIMVMITVAHAVDTYDNVEVAEYEGVLNGEVSNGGAVFTETKDYIVKAPKDMILNIQTEEDIKKIQNTDAVYPKADYTLEKAKIKVTTDANGNQSLALQSME